MMIAFFKDGRGRIVGEHRIMLPRRSSWHFAGDSFTIPEDATRLDAFFRLSYGTYGTSTFEGAVGGPVGWKASVRQLDPAAPWWCCVRWVAEGHVSR